MLKYMSEVVFWLRQRAGLRQFTEFLGMRMLCESIEADLKVWKSHGLLKRCSSKPLHARFGKSETSYYFSHIPIEKSNMITGPGKIWGYHPYDKSSCQDLWDCRRRYQRSRVKK